MKLLHFADSHVNVASHGNWTRRDDRSKRPMRAEDFLGSVDKIVDYAVKEKVDAVLFAGDAYDNENPENYYRDRFQKAVKTMAAAGIKVIMIPGNHDRNKKDVEHSALSSFDSLKAPNVLIAHEAKVFTPFDLGLNLSVVAIPWLVSETSEKMTRQNLADLADSLITEAQKYDAPIVLLTHGIVEGASLNSYQKVEDISGEMSYALETVADSRLSYTALGHLHVHQVLNQEPPVVYSGSTERCDMSEAKNDKGFVEVNINEEGKAEFEFKTIKPRRMFDIKVTPSPDAFMDDIFAALPSENLLKDSIVKLTVTCRTADKGKVLFEDIEKFFEKADVFQIVGACPNFDVIQEHRMRMIDPEQMKTIQPVDLLKKYLERSGKDSSDIERLLAMDKQLSEKGK